MSLVIRFEEARILVGGAGVCAKSSDLGNEIGAINTSAVKTRLLVILAVDWVFTFFCTKN